MAREMKDSGIKPIASLKRIRLISMALSAEVTIVSSSWLFILSDIKKKMIKKVNKSGKNQHVNSISTMLHRSSFLFLILSINMPFLILYFPYIISIAGKNCCSQSYPATFLLLFLTSLKILRKSCRPLPPGQPPAFHRKFEEAVRCRKICMSPIHHFQSKLYCRLNKRICLF